MSEQGKSSVSVAEEVVAFERDGVVEPAPRRPVLLANPQTRTPDWDAILDDIERRFPKTLARLAE